MSNRLILAGAPGVGKSTVGALCAARLGWRLVDTDEELTRRQGLPVVEIFARHGEAHFRQLEAALCQELAAESQVVIATGGGTVVHEAARTALLQGSVAICLTATPKELARRLGPEAGRTRPLLRSQVPDDLSQLLEELLQQRAAAYGVLPYHLDTTTATPAAVAEIACGLAAAEDERLVVTHPTGHYDLAIGSGLLDYIGTALAGRGYSGPLAIVSDTNVGPLYAARVQASLTAAGFSSFVHLFPAGEAHKNLATLEAIYQALSAGGVERGGAVVALGGGVVGDTAGMAAATYLRGVGLVQVPTSLLAMADSSIGGKVGVDIAAGKNLVGAFKQPDLVLMDLDCLRTLPQVELRAGLGEVVKAALIAGGAAYSRLQVLAKKDPSVCSPRALSDLPALLGPLRDALELKRTLVQADPHERGRRILLNLGHTFAHGLEPFSDYQLRHGDAVSLGLICAAELSARLGWCAAGFPAELTGLLHRLGLPTTLPLGRAPDTLHRDASSPPVTPVTDGKDDEIERAIESIWAFMQRDKKRRARRSRFVLLRAPGNVFTCELADDQPAKDALRAVLRPAPRTPSGE